MAEAATEAMAQVSLTRQPSDGEMLSRANRKQPPGRVRDMFMRLDADGSGGLSKEEVLTGFAKEFKAELAPHVLKAIDDTLEKHGEDTDGGKIISKKIFGRFYCEVLFRHFDANGDGILDLAEVTEALKFMAKPDADGNKVAPVVAFPPEFSKEDGNVELPIQWFWAYFSSLD